MKYGCQVFFVFAFNLCLLGQTETNEIVRVQKKRQLATYDIRAIPNPSPNEILLSAPEGSICRVYSITGTYVGTWEIRNEGLKLRDLGSGAYVAVVSYLGEHVRRRFMIL